jgi:acyl carrier protein
MRSREEILEWVIDVIKQQFQFVDEELRAATHLVDDLDLDSIDAIDLAVRLEEETGLALGEDELKSIRTIEDIVDMIDGRL